MLNNKIVLSTLSALFLSSSCLFGMDPSHPSKEDAPAAPPVRPSAVGCEGVPLNLDPTAVAVPVVPDLDDRPAEVKAAENKAFMNLFKKTGSLWRHGGRDSSYDMCGLDDYKFILYLVRSRGDQKIIRIGDIGGGEHGWARGMLHVINAQPGLPADHKVHLYSFTGESRPCYESVVLEETKEEGRCTLHEHYQFEIENLDQALEERGIHAPFDLFVSSWTLRHLVNPRRVLELAYRRLNPNGFMISDGFFVKVNRGRDIPDEAKHSKVELVFLLQDMEPEFLIRPTDGLPLNEFIVHKTQKKPYQRSLRCDGVEDFSQASNVFSGYVTCYTGPHRELSEEDIRKLHPNYKSGDKTVTGSERLYNLLLGEKLFYSNALSDPIVYLGDFSNQVAEAGPAEAAPKE